MIAHGDDHTLNGLTITQTEQKFPCAIGGNLSGVNLQGLDFIRVSYFRTEGSGQVAHVIPLKNAMLINPLRELTGPERRSTL